MSTREQRLERRIEILTATDPQFAAAKPDPAVVEALEQPGLQLPQIIQTVLEGYGDRPALGQRAVEFVEDPKTGRTVLGLLPTTTPSPTVSCANASTKWPAP